MIRFLHAYFPGNAQSSWGLRKRVSYRLPLLPPRLRGWVSALQL